MKDLKEMIDEINIESIENAINVLRGLKACKNEKCKTCRFKVKNDFICGVCNYEEKEPEKPIEKQVFELIGYDLDKLNFPANDIEFLKDAVTECENPYFKQCLFLAIIKGVHQIIEGDNKSDERFIFRYNHEYTPFYEVLQVKYKVTNFPYFWYYSTHSNAKKARDILSNFFGINILDWWFKND